jgi:hypothetical protein
MCESARITRPQRPESQAAAKPLNAADKFRPFLKENPWPTIARSKCREAQCWKTSSRQMAATTSNPAIRSAAFLALTESPNRFERMFCDPPMAAISLYRGWVCASNAITSGLPFHP